MKQFMNGSQSCSHAVLLNHDVNRNRAFNFSYIISITCIYTYFQTLALHFTDIPESGSSYFETSFKIIFMLLALYPATNPMSDFRSWTF